MTVTFQELDCSNEQDEIFQFIVGTCNTPKATLKRLRRDLEAAVRDAQRREQREYSGASA